MNCYDLSPFFYTYKLVLEDVIIEKLSPIRKDTLRLTRELAYLDEILKKGAKKSS